MLVPLATSAVVLLAVSVQVPVWFAASHGTAASETMAPALNREPATNRVPPRRRAPPWITG